MRHLPRSARFPQRRSQRPPAAALALGVALVCAPHARARADDARIAQLELHWDAPEACPEREQVLRWIADYLPVRTLAPGAPLVVEVRVRALAAPRFEVAIRMPGAEAERSFGGDDCRRVAEAAALIVAMSMDPLGTSARVSAPPEPAPAPESPTIAVAARMAGDIGSLPQPSLGLPAKGTARARPSAAAPGATRHRPEPGRAR